MQCGPNDNGATDRETMQDQNQNADGGTDDNQNGIEIKREVITVRTNLDVPDNYPALPIFAGQGWIGASVEAQKPESVQYRIEDNETGARLLFTPHWERSDELPSSHPEHISSRGEKGKSGNGDTYAVGDFLVDFRKKDGRWTGMDWETWNPQLRVRVHPDVADPAPKVVVETPDGDEGGDD